MILEPQQNRFRALLVASLGLIPALLLLLLLSRCTKLFSPAPPKPPEVVISSVTVKDGDIMSTILTSKGLPPELVTKVQAEIGRSFNLRRMKPKDNFEVVSSTNGLFLKLIYHDDPTHAYAVTRSSMGVLTT